MISAETLEMKPLKYDSEIVRTFFEQLKPPSDIPIYEHAAQHFLLPQESSAIPGYFNVDKTPYLKEIMECLHFNSGVQEVVFQKSAQIGGTSVTLAMLLWMMESGQSAPCLVVFPTEKTSQRFVKTKFRPALHNCRSLQNKLQNMNRNRDTLGLFDVPSGPLSFGNAHAPNTLRMDSCRVVICDEVSDFLATDQGCPIEIAKGRMTTYSERKKLYLVSTPNVEESCRITAAYKDSDQRKYFVPCPHCKYKQVLKFEQLKWKSGFEDIHYECESCKKKIYEQMKPWMLENGEWSATAEDRFHGLKAGFQINGLYSPLELSWRSIIQQFIAAKDDQHLLQVWKNNIMGEPFKSSIEISKKQLNKRVEDYKIYPRLPRGVDLVTCGADFNEHHTNLEFVGWGRNFQSWGLDYVVIEKHISDPTLWIELNDLLSRRFMHYKGKEITVAASALDSGYAADTVWNFVSKFQGDGRNIIAIRGTEGIGQRIISTKASRSEKSKFPFYQVSRHTSNETLFAWLNVRNKEDAGYCRFSKSYLKTNFFDELTAVSKTKVAKGRNPVGRWVKDPSKRQEGNDVRRYAIAALYHLTHLGFDLSSHCDFFQKFDLDQVNEEIRKL